MKACTLLARSCNSIQCEQGREAAPAACQIEYALSVSENQASHVLLSQAHHMQRSVPCEVLRYLHLTACQASFPPFAVCFPGAIRLATASCHPPACLLSERSCYATLV
jgi:hypothetical protein